MTKSAIEEYRSLDTERKRATLFEAAANLMDSKIRDELAYEMAPCGEEEFLEAYCVEHARKFNEEVFSV